MITETTGKDGHNGHANNGSLGSVLRGSANQIWLAGLGAYARAEEEGTRLFDQLVTMGERVERRARTQVTRPIRAVERKAGEVRDTATGAVGAVRHAFARRVQRLLNALQIPTSRDVEALTTRVEELTVALDRMERRVAAQQPAAVARAGRPRVRKKSAAAGARKSSSSAKGRRASGAARTRD